MHSKIPQEKVFVVYVLCSILSYREQHPDNRNIFKQEETWKALQDRIISDKWVQKRIVNHIKKKHLL
jgi:hypothetical protein